MGDQHEAVMAAAVREKSVRCLPLCTKPTILVSHARLACWILVAYSTIPFALLDSAVVGVLYLGYRGMLVMTYPHNPAQEMPRVLAVAPGGFQYRVGTAGVGSSRGGDIECLAR
jgi:hypothetical protein